MNVSSIFLYWIFQIMRCAMEILSQRIIKSKSKCSFGGHDGVICAAQQFHQLCVYHLAYYNPFKGTKNLFQETFNLSNGIINTCYCNTQAQERFPVQSVKCICIKVFLRILSLVIQSVIMHL